ncbi:MAG: PorV/PorQ family protein [Ignavibacteria bacterium]|nr:PorV/PorQ family protein [Ignavibacteria bacterium]
MKRTIVFLLAASLMQGGINLLLAQKVATSSFQFLKVMPTSRATAMGEAYSTQAIGADAVFWNPAGVALTEQHEITSTLTLWLFDTKQGALAYALPLGDWGSLGFQLQYVDFGDMVETTVEELRFIGSGADRRYNPGITGRTFRPSAYVAGITYARSLTDRFSTGLTVKFVNESLYGNRTITVVTPEGEKVEYRTYARVFLFDYGLRYNTGFRSIQVGVAVQNLGPSVKYGVDAYPAPLTFRLGTSLNLIGENALFILNDHNRFTVAYDMVQPNDYAQQMHFGAEYSLSESVFLRGGYKWNYDADGLTFGGGLRTTLSGFNVGLDYSYGAMGEYLGQVHRISMGVKFK